MLGRVTTRRLALGTLWLWACGHGGAAVASGADRPDTGVTVTPPALAPTGDSAPAAAVAPAQSPPSPAVATKEPSTSIGSPSDGTLRSGAALPLAGRGYRFNDKRSAEARYGTDEVVAAIARAAARVADEVPGSELVVNDLSLREGGPIPHHGSHRAGRDADILFYLLDGVGTPIASVGAPLDPAGRGVDFKELAIPDDDVPLQLDAQRTWRFVAALLDDPDALVQRIFVVEHLRTMLLAEARRQHAPATVLQRFEEVTCQPGYPHDDHLHVRWFCSAEDAAAGCEEQAPLYPWFSAAMASAGVTPALAKKRAAREKAEVTTQAEADRAVKAASPHADVLAFLARRKAWEKQPHPGRPYCR
jgi:penicillin-insensitive murein DD-endopeptidase